MILGLTFSLSAAEINDTVVSNLKKSNAFQNEEIVVFEAKQNIRTPMQYICYFLMFAVVLLIFNGVFLSDSGINWNYLLAPVLLIILSKTYFAASGASIRGKIRTKYEIPGSYVGDFCIWFFLESFAAQQESGMYTT